MIRYLVRALCLIAIVRATCVADDSTYCRLRFGIPGTEILLERTADAILIYRDGKRTSTPEEHAIKKAAATDLPITEFEIKPVTYKLTLVAEYVEKNKQTLVLRVVSEKR